MESKSTLALLQTGVTHDNNGQRQYFFEDMFFEKEGGAVQKKKIEVEPALASAFIRAWSKMTQGASFPKEASGYLDSGFDQYHICYVKGKGTFGGWMASVGAENGPLFLMTRIPFYAKQWIWRGDTLAKENLKKGIEDLEKLIGK